MYWRGWSVSDDALRMGVEELERKLEELRKRKGVIRHMFEQQRAFVLDPSKKKTALCSRRAGKTYSVGCYLIMEAMRRPETLCVYVTLTRKSAKLILWEELKRLLGRFGIEYDANLTELTLRLENGSVIWLSGAKDSSEIEKFRGMKYPIVVLDEAASFKPYIASLVFEVFEPALLDMDGTMVMIGTPSAACMGAFYDATTKKDSGWSVHHWTIRDNPHIPHAKAWLAQKMKENGWTEDNPIYRREWLGQWVRDAESLVYRYTPGVNSYSDLAEESRTFERAEMSEMSYVIGIDLGYDDATAFVVVGFHEGSPNVYIVDEYQQSEMLIHDIAEHIKKLLHMYKPIKIVADTGGLGKSIVEEIKQRHRVPIFPAEKRNKVEYIELMNSDFAAGFIKAKEDSQLAQDWQLLQWDPNINHKKIEDSRFDNHLPDACLYAWRESRHYTHMPDEIPPEPGTPEAIALEEQQIIDNLEKQIREEEEELDFYSY